MYKIIRFRHHGSNRTIKRNLSLEEARRHCQDPKTSKKDKAGNVVWFDGYTEQ
jgi:hypothetical protein